MRSGFGVKAGIALRVNPDVDPKTHPHISTGLKENKFGIDIERSLETYRQARSLQNLDIKGVSCTSVLRSPDCLLSLRLWNG